MEDFKKYHTEIGEKTTKSFEGWRSKPYKDPGGKNMAVGWGFNLQEGGIPEDVVSGKRELTKEEAQGIFETKYFNAIKNAIDFAGLDAFAKMDEGQRNTIIDMAYQMGGPTLSKFGGMKKAIQAGDYERAALEMQYNNPNLAPEKRALTPWYQQSGRRSKSNVAQILGGN